ncbi:MAG: 3'-5' exonuclease [Gammaproteobacteria bacterium]|nr:3'-5' exonuclease [Gammaproteobacteria bacterium]
MNDLTATPILVFDIETIPDIAGLRKLLALNDHIPDSEVEPTWHKKRQAEGKNSTFLPHYVHKVIVISCLFRDQDNLRMQSYTATSDLEEAQIIQEYFQLFSKYAPQLVSWNGGGFDLPVLHYRGLQHKVSAPQYWSQGERSHSDSKWNNYINRYHHKHLDLMDVLARYQGNANAPLDALAKLCGYPGKLGLDGSQVHEAFLQGKLQTIRQYCETDVLNTYLLFLRFCLMRGYITAEELDQEELLVQQKLLAWYHKDPEYHSHWSEYFQIWLNPL